MRNVEVALKSIENGRKVRIIFRNITCHLIFDVKFDLTRKSKYVGHGPLTQVPESVSYSRMVSRDPVKKSSL